MIKEGFDENTEQHREMNRKLFELAQEKEDMKSKLDKKAYAFELQDLMKRLRRCETKLGISYS